MHDDEMDEMFPLLPELKIEDLPEWKDIDFKIEIDPETERLLAEQEQATQRWVDSGFKLGADLPAASREKFDRWVLATVKAAIVDPIAASGRLQELAQLFILNDRRIRSYKSLRKVRDRLSRATPSSRNADQDRKPKKTNRSKKPSGRIRNSAPGPTRRLATARLQRAAAPNPSSPNEALPMPARHASRQPSRRRKPH
jgi:hypothetical protein